MHDVMLMCCPTAWAHAFAVLIRQDTATHHDVSQQLEPSAGRLVHRAGRHAVADVIAELLLRGTWPEQVRESCTGASASAAWVARLARL